MPTPKPDKPTPDFPLFAHASGQWAKKIGGKVRYFGVWSDPDAALARYREASKEAARGRIARAERPAKPSGDFPLFAHNCGQWAKKI
jgi:hypothetical protein